jgi:hypothetical protein
VASKALKVNAPSIKPNKEITMTNKIKPANNSANIKNANKGTPGVNKQNAQVNGNRGKQLNPNQKKD